MYAIRSYYAFEQLFARHQATRVLGRHQAQAKLPRHLHLRWRETFEHTVGLTRKRPFHPTHPLVRLTTERLALSIPVLP